MRTTAIYGSGKFGAADRAVIADRPELAGPFTLSRNETESLCMKAARGAGFSWGMAEEAGFATGWLCPQAALLWCACLRPQALPMLFLLAEAALGLRDADLNRAYADVIAAPKRNAPPMRRPAPGVPVVCY